MKKFYRKLKGWKKFWFWMIVLALVINFLQLVNYTFEKARWDYFMNNKEISLLTKIVFPSPSIISEKEKIGFIVSRSAPFHDMDIKNGKGFINFSEYWRFHKEKKDWGKRIGDGAIIVMYMYFIIIIEWFYFFFWQIIVKIFIWNIVIKFFLWEFIIKSFLWEFLLRGLIWETVIKGFIWGVLLSGNWLK